MANEIRRRYNFKSGTITDNPLSNSATTMNSTNLAGLAAITTVDYAVLVLDPGGTGNGPEVVYMTAHTGSATSGTIVRGREGTTAVQHNSNVIWIHVATAADYPLVGTSSEQPSGNGLPYEGQLYVDSTNDQVQVYDGTNWKSFNYGAWLSWSPTFKQSNTPAQTVTDARYMRLGRTVIASAFVTFSGDGTASNAITCTYPVTPRTPTNAPVVGTFTYFDSGSTNHQGSIIYSTASTVKFIYDGFGNDMGSGDFAITSGDSMRVFFTYETAS